jgi:outer membrane protein assembly factor BamA
MHLGYGYSDVEGSIATAGPARGVAFSAGFDYADDATGSEYSFRAFEASLSTYFSMPWPGHHTLAVRSAGALAGGTYSRNGVYFVGGYDLENVSLVDSVTTGAFDGAFVVRGYPARSFVGRQYLLYNMEYRVPIFAPDRGISTLPVFFRRIDANLFLDYGGAFNRLDLHATRLFHAGNVIDSPDMHAALGGELWFNVTFGYFLTTQLRLGYAHGFSAGAIEGGQLYFVAAGAF